MSTPRASIAAASDPGAEVVDALIRRSGEANAALMRGDVDRFRALVPHADDYLLMSPFGGIPTCGAALTEEKWSAVGRFFRNGTFEQTVLQSHATAAMVVLA